MEFKEFLTLERGESLRLKEATEAFGRNEPNKPVIFKRHTVFLFNRVIRLSEESGVAEVMTENDDFHIACNKLELLELEKPEPKIMEFDLSEEPHWFIRTWHFNKDIIGYNEKMLANAVSYVAEQNGLSNNDISHLFPVILRILKSQTVWSGVNP